MLNLSATQLALTQNEVSSCELLDKVYARIKSASLQGSVSFLSTLQDQAYQQAKDFDCERLKGVDLPPLAGIPISVKDNFDIQGQTTTAGSKVLSKETPATNDAPFISQLKQAGAIIVGRTNMTEFAYSGLGLNRHFGTPLSPIGEGLIAGGSTSGGAVSVAQGMSLFAVGSDTSGSCRIPAACCGLVGYRPSKNQFSIEGIVPLAISFDVPGLLAKKVSCIELVTQALTTHCAREENLELKDKRFLVPSEIESKTYDPIVKTYFEQFLSRLGENGATIVRQPFLFREITEQSSPAEIVIYEAFQYHQPLLAKHKDHYDPRIAMRMDKAAGITKSHYNRLLSKLHELRIQGDKLLTGFDGVLLPTLPILPPSLKELQDEERYFRANTLIIRNTAIANHLDLPAICFPVKQAIAEQTPVSIQLIGKRHQDQSLLALASSLSKLC